MHRGNGRTVAAYLTEEYVDEYIALIRAEGPKLDRSELRRIGINWFTAFGHVPVHDREQRDRYSKVLRMFDELLGDEPDES